MELGRAIFTGIALLLALCGVLLILFRDRVSRQREDATKKEQPGFSFRNYAASQLTFVRARKSPRDAAYVGATYLILGLILAGTGLFGIR